MREDKMKVLIRQEMSFMHAPDDLVADTLRKMNAEYERKTRREAKKRQGESFFRGLKQSRKSFALGGLAVAMAAVICVSAYQQSSMKLRFEEFVYQPDMRMEMSFRAGDDGESSLASICEEFDEKMSGELGEYKRQDYSFHEFSLNAQMPALWVAKAVYDAETCEPFEVAVTNFATAVYDVLGSGNEQQINGLNVYTGRDKQTNDLFAVWQDDGYYVQIQLPGDTEWKDDTLIRLFESVAEMLK